MDADDLKKKPRQVAVTSASAVVSAAAVTTSTGTEIEATTSVLALVTCGAASIPATAFTTTATSRVITEVKAASSTTTTTLPAPPSVVLVLVESSPSSSSSSTSSTSITLLPTIEDKSTVTTRLPSASGISGSHEANSATTSGLIASTSGVYKLEATAITTLTPVSQDGYGQDLVATDVDGGVGTVSGSGINGGGGTDAYGLTSYYDIPPPPPPSSTKKEDFEERPPCIFTPPDTLYSNNGVDHKDNNYGQYHHNGHHGHHQQQQQQHYTQLSNTCSSSGEPSPPPGSVGVGGVSASGITSGHSPLGMTVLYEQKGTGTTKSSQSKTSKADQSFAAADSNSGNTPSKAFVPCKVCGDKASGYHYGVTSCEGCKGFFRRSIQKQIEYRCLRDGKCLVIRLNRNRCQYCRFKKCIAVGMSRDSVRYGRVPKRSRERNDEARVTQSEADQSARDMENKQLAIYDIILTISQAHHANCAYTEERTRALARKPAVFNLDEIKMEPSDLMDSTTSSTSSTTTTATATTTTTDTLEQQKFFMWQQFATYVTPSIQRVVEFAKRTPGFSDLSQDDQLILIKSSFFEVWLVHVSRLVSPLDNTLTFSDGSYVDRHNLDIVFDPEFITALFTFAVTFNNLQLSDTEIGIFSAVVLLTSDRPGISDHKFIEQQQEKLVEALKLQVARHHAGDVHFLPNVILKLGELRALGVKHVEHLQWFRLHWDKLKLPPLFAEIFDIPKGDEDFIQ